MARKKSKKLVEELVEQAAQEFAVFDEPKSKKPKASSKKQVEVVDVAELDLADPSNDTEAEFIEAEVESQAKAEVEPMLESEFSAEEMSFEASDDADNNLIANTDDEGDEADIEADVEGTELAEFDSAEIEDVELIEEERLDSIVESLLFASDKPLSLATIKGSFKGTNVRTEHIRKSIQRLTVDLAGGRRGMSLEEVSGGYQVRTKLDNMKFLTRSVKPKAFRLSGPALEVLAIVAYKQPVVKSEIDDIRGVESGHLLRALMEKGLVGFEGKSELPGKPMQYGTSRKFLDIFGLRNLKELPTLSQIDELLPDGIGDENDAEKEVLGDLTSRLSQEIATTYSEGEDELLQISEQLQDITTTTDFFEDEKAREKRAKDEEKARQIREALMDTEKAPSVSNRDKKWLERFDLALAEERSPSTPGLTNQSESMEVTSESLGESLAIQATSEISIEDNEDLNQIETEEGRFSEEEDISLDQDLNIPLHDPEESV